MSSYGLPVLHTCLPRHEKAMGLTSYAIPSWWTSATVLCMVDICNCSMHFCSASYMFIFLHEVCSVHSHASLQACSTARQVGPGPQWVRRICGHAESHPLPYSNTVTCVQATRYTSMVNQHVMPACHSSMSCQQCAHSIVSHTCLHAHILYTSMSCQHVQ